MKAIFRVFIIGALTLFGLAVSGQEYKRVISLAPSLTKNLYYLQSQDKLIGCTSYCEMAKNDSIDIVASAIKVNLEMAVRLKPDLVIATGITDPETIEYFKKFGIRTEIFYTPKNFSEICTQFIRLGELVGKKRQAETVVNDYKNRLDSLKKNFIWEKPPRIFIQIGANPIFAVTSGNFMDDYIRFINGVNVASNLKHGTVSREYVLGQGPDIIFVVTMGMIGDEEKNIWLNYKGLSASKKGNVFIIDSDMACTPTPVSFVKTIETISEILKK